MRCLTVPALLIVLAVPVTARADDKDAKKVAQATLDKGAALYDARDAAALAATYAEDAQVHWIDKDNSTGELKDSVKNGRAEVESMYRDLFKGNDEKTTSRNTVEYARFVAPDLLVIHGVFQPNVDKEGKYPFVQVRVKQGEKWLMKSLQLFAISQD
jgi:hypothetical protein